MLRYVFRLVKSPVGRVPSWALRSSIDYGF